MPRRQLDMTLFAPEAVADPDPMCHEIATLSPR